MTNAVAKTETEQAQALDVMPLTEQETQVIRQVQSLTKTAYDDRVLATMMRDQISAKDGQSVTLADVLQMLRLAGSMHLDPVMGGLWGYKDNNGQLVYGVTKKGWQQALHSQPDYCGIEFKHPEPIQVKKFPTKKGMVEISYYPVSVCVISKKMPDGTIGHFSGTAYFDEEFDSVKPTWIQRPKRMLDTRALTICASNAYGWGAYDKEDIEGALGYDAPQLTAVDAVKRLKACIDREQMVEVFRSFPDEIRKNPQVIDESKRIAQEFSK